MASAPFSTAARAHSQSPAGASNSGRRNGTPCAGGVALAVGWTLFIGKTYFTALMRGDKRKFGGMTKLPAYLSNRCRHCRARAPVEAPLLARGNLMVKIAPLLRP